MPIPATPVEVRFSQSEQRKFSKFLLPGQLTLAENVNQLQEGLYEKRDGFTPIDATGLPVGVEPTDLGLAGNVLAQATTDGLYLRGSTWELAEPHEQAFGTYETVLPSAGFRPSRLTDTEDQTWHFSATQDIDPSTGSTRRYPVYRVTDADDRELVPPTVIENVSISAGKALQVGDFVFFYYHEFGVGIHVAVFDVNDPGTVLTLATVHPSAGILLGFDVRVVPDTGAGLLMVWGTGIDGGTGAVGVARLDAATGLLAGSMVYTPFADAQGAYGSGCLARSDHPGRGFFGAVSHIGTVPTVDKVEAVEINPTTLACTFTQLSIGDFSGSHQFGAVVHDGSLEVFWSDMRELMNPVTAVPPPAPLLWRLSLDLGTATPAADFLGYGAWLVAEPVVHDDRILLVLGHESRFSSAAFPQVAPQRCYSLFDVAAEKTLCRAMYEAGGGDGDALAGAGYGYVQGSFVTNVEVDGDTLVLNVNACRDGLHDFQTVELRFDLAPDVGPPVQVEDNWFVPGGYPRWLGSWGRALDAAPQFFPEHVTATAASGVGFPTYAGTFQVTATYVLITPDGDEVESQAAEIEDVTTTGSQWVRVVVPTLKQFAGTDAAAKAFVRVYATTDGGSTLFRQAQRANRTDVDTLTFDLPAIGVGPTLYQEGAIEHTAVPPCRVAAYWDQRLFVSGLAEKGVVYPSNYIEAGELPAFIDDGKFSVGPTEVRALCAIDKNYLAVFHDGGIAVVARGGHTRAGTNVYEAVQLPNATQTTTNPRSVVTTDKGCVFQGTDGGVYLLTRSLEVVEIGRGVESHRAETVTSAVYLSGAQQVRLTTADNVLVFDMRNRPVVPQTAGDVLGQWYVWPLASAGLVAGVVHDGAHHALAADGQVWHQVEGQAYDGVDTFIPMRLRLPLSFQGIVAFLRCLRGLLLSQWVGPHVLQLTVETDGTETPLAPKTLDTAKKRPDFRPSPSKAAHFVLDIEEQQHADSLNKGFRLEGLGFEVQRQPGLARGDTRAGS